MRRERFALGEGMDVVRGSIARVPRGVGGSPLAAPHSHNVLHEVNEALGLRLPEEEDVETIAGLFLSLHGKIPREGDEVEVGKVKLMVEQLIGRRIASLILSKDGKG